MKAKRVRLLLIAIVVLSTLATYTVRAWEQDTSTNFQPRPVETGNENMIKNELSALLSPVGVHVGEIPIETANHKRLTVRWRTSGDGEKSLHSVSLQGPGILSVATSATRAGSPQTFRRLELSSIQMLVVAVDELQQLQWWHQMPDPRVVRAEAPNVDGQQNVGRTLYLTQTEFVVAYPTNPAIGELRFYHPLWNGKTYQLELIGSVSVK